MQGEALATADVNVTEVCVEVLDIVDVNVVEVPVTEVETEVTKTAALFETNIGTEVEVVNRELSRGPAASLEEEDGDVTKVSLVACPLRTSCDCSLVWGHSCGWG